MNALELDRVSSSRPPSLAFLLLAISSPNRPATLCCANTNYKAIQKLGSHLITELHFIHYHGRHCETQEAHRSPSSDKTEVGHIYWVITSSFNSTVPKANCHRCWTCRSRKVKCDERIQGGCGVCEKSSLECAGYGVNLCWITDKKQDFHGLRRRQIKLGKALYRRKDTLGRS